MPLLTRLWIKTALVYFVLGLFLGALLAGPERWNHPPACIGFISILYSFSGSWLDLPIDHRCSFLDVPQIYSAKAAPQ